MALRARLVAPPPPPPSEWPWHTVRSGSVSVSRMVRGDRRIDADTFLSSGYGVRAAIESHSEGWMRLEALAKFWAPPRIKTIEVAQEHGVPYLNTTQVFDIRPFPRKFLAAGKTHKAEERLVDQGSVLVMASANVGRTTIATAAHEGCFVSHHLMRATPNDAGSIGWIYAFLHSPQGQAMLRSSQYASVIRHIEPHHVEAIPIPIVGIKIAGKFAQQFRELLELRNRAYRLSELADERFSEIIGQPGPMADEERGFEVPARSLMAGRRRFEANYYAPQAAAIFSRFKKWEPLSEVCERVWWMPRFKRFYGNEGIPYLSADELFTTNPEMKRRILVAPNDNHEAYFVKRDWLVMACSGQVYGLNGAAILTTERHENIFFSHDLIRIVANKNKIHPGYLLVALTNRTHGRPLLIRAAYGTSIPHLDPGDVEMFPVVRLGEEAETAIADLAVAAAQARSAADALEQQMADDAGKIVSRLITHGPERIAEIDTY